MHLRACNLRLRQITLFSEQSRTIATQPALGFPWLLQIFTRADDDQKSR